MNYCNFKRPTLNIKSWEKLKPLRNSKRHRFLPQEVTVLGVHEGPLFAGVVGRCTHLQHIVLKEPPNRKLPHGVRWQLQKWQGRASYILPHPGTWSLWLIFFLYMLFHPQRKRFKFSDLVIKTPLKLTPICVCARMYINTQIPSLYFSPLQKGKSLCFTEKQIFSTRTLLSKYAVVNYGPTEDKSIPRVFWEYGVLIVYHNMICFSFRRTLVMGMWCLYQLGHRGTYVTEPCFNAAAWIRTWSQSHSHSHLIICFF